MPTYYVLSDITTYEPRVSKHDKLETALECYEAEMHRGGWGEPVLVQQLDVQLATTDLDGNMAEIPLGGDK